MQLTTNHAKVILFNSSNGEETFKNRGQVNSLKKHYIAQIEDQILIQGISLTKAQWDILGLLVYNTCVTGVQSISLSKLVDKSGYSRATVARAKKAICELGFFSVGYLGDEQKGHYVFVLKLHENHDRIMQALFNETSCETSCDNSNETSSNFETPCESKAEGEKKVSTLFTFNTLNTLKQENNNKESATKDLEDLDVQENLEERTEYMNDAQKKLYYSIKAGDFHSLINQEAYKIALRVGKDFNHLRAMKAVIKLDTALKSHAEELTSIPATFEYYFKIELEKAANVATAPIEEEQAPVTRQPIPFFNWLDN
jgi:DNA-binding MarR family transcriptional regulator